MTIVNIGVHANDWIFVVTDEHVYSCYEMHSFLQLFTIFHRHFVFILFLLNLDQGPSIYDVGTDGGVGVQLEVDAFRQGRGIKSIMASTIKIIFSSTIAFYKVVH